MVVSRRVFFSHISLISLSIIYTPVSAVSGVIEAFASSASFLRTLYNHLICSKRYNILRTDEYFKTTGRKMMDWDAKWKICVA